MTEISFSCGRGRGENRIALKFSKIDHRTHPENLKLYSPGNPKLYTPENPKLYSPEKPRLYTPGNPKLYTRDFSSHLVRSFHLPPGGVRLGPGRSQEGRPRAPEQWPESSGKGLDNELQVNAIALLWAYGGARERCRLVQGVSWRCREGQRSRTVA